MFETKSIPGKIYENSEMVHFAETNQAPSPLLNIAAYLQNSNAEAFAKKLSQILTNSIDNRGKGDWYHNLCDLLSKKLMKNERGFGKPRHFFV